MIKHEEYDKSLSCKKIPASIVYYIKSYFQNKSGKYGTKTKYNNNVWYYGDMVVAQYVNNELYIKADYDKCNNSVLKMVTYLIEYYTITSDNKFVTFTIDYERKFEKLMQSTYA